MQLSEITRSPRIQKQIDIFRDEFRKKQETIKTSYQDPIQEQVAISKLQKERKEAAKLLRMEMVITNAKLLQFSFREINSSPEITSNQLTKKIESTGMVLHPELTQTFIRDLITKRDIVANVLNRMGNSVDYVYNQLLPKDKRPKTPAKKKINLIKYPLAIVLEIDDADFDAIDPRTNIGGFHRSSQSFQIFDETQNTESTLRSPLIIARKNDKRIIPHEEIHAEHDSVRETLAQKSTSYNVATNKHFTVWGSWRFNSSAKESKNKLLELVGSLKWGNVLKEINLILRKGLEGAKKEKKRKGEYAQPAQFSELSQKEIRESEEFKKLISYALASAKEEILAEMQWDTGSGASYLKELLKKNKTYDYFVNYLEIPANTPLHNLLWEEYTKQLKEYTKYAYAIFLTYKSNPCWKERLKIYRYILLQWPVEEWNRQLEAAGFVEESKLYRQAQHCVFRLDKELRQNTSITVVNLSQEERYQLESLDIFYKSLAEEIQRNVNKPLQEYLKNKIGFANHVLGRNIEKTTLYQKIILFKEITKIITDIRDFANMMKSAVLEQDISENIKDQILLLTGQAENIHLELIAHLNNKNEITVQQLSSYKEKLLDLQNQIFFSP